VIYIQHIYLNKKKKKKLKKKHAYKSQPRHLSPSTLAIAQEKQILAKAEKKFIY
jgi:hypothetical protein